MRYLVSFKLNVHLPLTKASAFDNYLKKLKTIKGTPKIQETPKTRNIVVRYNFNINYNLFN